MASARSLFNLAFSSSSAPQLTGIGQVHPTVLRLVLVEGCIGYTVLAADVGHLRDVRQGSPCFFNIPMIGSSVNGKRFIPSVAQLL